MNENKFYIFAALKKTNKSTVLSIPCKEWRQDKSKPLN
jgi:hypothetical protein